MVGFTVSINCLQSAYWLILFHYGITFYKKKIELEMDKGYWIGNIAYLLFNFKYYVSIIQLHETLQD